MKEIFYYLTSIILLLSSCKNVALEAVNYNDAMIQKQDSIVSMIDSLDQLIIQRDTIKLPDFQKSIINTIDKKIESVKESENFEGNDSFKNAVLTLFNSYRDIVQNKYSKIISISLLPQVNFEKDTLDKFNRLIKEINEDFSKSLDIFLQYQKEFASQNKFSLVEEVKK